jgi:hypothetical protein
LGLLATAAAFSFLLFQSITMFTKFTFGVRRAIIERARRRGYAEAVADVVAEVDFRASQKTKDRLLDWQLKVAKWRRRAHVGADDTIEQEAAPTPNFRRLKMK